MVETTHVDPSTRDGRKHTREADKLFLDARENVGAPTSQCRQRRSLEWYTGYMSLVKKDTEIEPSSFEEAINQFGLMPWLRSMTPLSETMPRSCPKTSGEDSCRI